MKRTAAHALLIASLICPSLAATSFAHDTSRAHSHSHAEASASASASATVTINGHTSTSSSSSQASASASVGHTHNGHTHYEEDYSYDEDYDYDDGYGDYDGYEDDYEYEENDRSKRDRRAKKHRKHRRKERARRDRRRRQHPGHPHRRQRGERGHTHRCTSSCDHQHTHYDGCGHAGYDDGYDHDHVEAMSDREFSRFVAQIQAENFSSDRLQLVQVAAAGNYFTSSQVTAVVHLMTFGSNRVDAAVLLYPRVVDQDDFYQVFAAFTFDSNKRKVRKQLNI